MALGNNPSLESGVRGYTWEKVTVEGNLLDYLTLTIRIIWMLFIILKMNEYEYRIPLFGPYYSNSQIVRIIRTNTDSNYPIREIQINIRSYVLTFLLELNWLV